jgi:hypothetical protein
MQLLSSGTFSLPAPPYYSSSLASVGALMFFSSI